MSCPLCLHAGAESQSPAEGFSHWVCPNCSEFFIEEQLGIRTKKRLGSINNLSESEIERLKDTLGPIYDAVHVLSGTAKLAAIEGIQPRRFDEDTAREAIRSAPGDVVEKADRLLLSLGVLASMDPWRIFEITPDYQALAFARNHKEYLYIAKMLGDWGLAELVADDQAFWLTADGWKRIRELRTAGADSMQAFVAMRIHESTEPMYDAIRKAIERNGYDALRMDEDIYTGLIDERMLVQIDKSRFLVAEVTDKNRGAYFEAGYALGQRKPVFFTCREDKIKKQHFDINHYVHIPWREPADIVDALDTRIRFWVGSLEPRDD